MYLPVLAIGVQGEAHLTRSHGPAAGLKVHNFRLPYYCTPRGAQVRLFSLRSTDDVISPRKRYDGRAYVKARQPARRDSRSSNDMERAAEIAVW